MEQPTGIRAFGWGILGYFGSNIIINLCTSVAGMAGDPNGNPGHFFGFVLGMIFAGMFANSRNYRATSVGAWIAFWLAMLAFIAGFLGAANGY